MPEQRGRFGQRLGADIVHAQLREVRIAGDRDGALHIDGAVGVIADIVLDRRDSIPRWCCRSGRRQAGGRDRCDA